MTSTFSIDSFLIQSAVRVNEPQPVCNTRRHSISTYQPYQPVAKRQHRESGHGEYRLTTAHMNTRPKLSIEIPIQDLQQSIVSPTQSQLESPISYKYQSFFPPESAFVNTTLKTPPESPINGYFGSVNFPSLHQFLNAPIAPYEPFSIPANTPDLFNRPLLFGDGPDEDQYPRSYDSDSSTYSFQPTPSAFSPQTSYTRKASLSLDPAIISPATSGSFSCPCNRVFRKRCGISLFSFITRSDLSPQITRKER
jgi:hypothetical protein